jgi:thiol-disulfide isomerase/thioredoxin
LYSLILLLGLAWTVASADRSGASTAGKIPAPQKGFLAPELSLQTLDGQEVTLASLRGRVVLVNFWASWCPPCRAEMPAMQRVHEEYENQGLTVLAVNATIQDSQTEAARFAALNGLTFPIPLDMDGQAARRYAVRSLPTSFFIGRDGIIREVIIGGPMAEALLRTRVEKLLKEKP